MSEIYVADGDLDANGVKSNLSVFSELAAQKADITIDMSAVESIDGSGIGALVFLYKRLRSSGHQVRLTKVRSEPLGLLEKLDLAEIFSASSGGAFTVVRRNDKVEERASKVGSDYSQVRQTP